MSLQPAFQKWISGRSKSNRLSPSIPTRNSNPTPKAGAKNSNGPKGGSGKAKVTVPRNSNAKATVTAPKAKTTKISRTGVSDPRKSSVARPRGKVRATNNPRLSSRKG